MKALSVICSMALFVLACYFCFNEEYGKAIFWAIISTRADVGIVWQTLIEIKEKMDNN